MIKNILNTVFVRIFNAAITLIVVIINSNVIGAEGMGTVSLIILAVSIFILLTGFVSGALIYFVPRENILSLFLISWIWMLVSFVLFFVFMSYVPIVPKKYILHVCFLSLIFAGSNINEKILTGKEKIIPVNTVALIRILFLILPLIILYYSYSLKSVNSYIYALYFSYSSGFLVSFFLIIQFLKIESPRNLYSLFKRVLKLSSYNAFGNLVQKLNYRLSYYLIDFFLGIKALGQFSVAVQVSESALIISRSIAFVHYSKISNLKSRLKGIKITLALTKFILLFSTAIVIVLSVLPSDIYSYIFSKDFFNLNSSIISLSIGIIFLSASMIFSSFFAGTGRHYYNMQASLTGFIITLIFGFLLIPEFHLIGAGLTASFSYIASFSYQFFLMKKYEKIRFNDLLLKREDVRIYKELFFNQFLKSNKHNNPA